jgi:uncharacterized membrane protein
MKNQKLFRLTGGLFMSKTNRFNILSAILIGVIFFSGNIIYAGDSLTLYTPYTKISVPPGESINYTIDIINNSNSRKNADISIAGIPKGWIYFLKSGGWTIGQLSVLPGERKSIDLKVEVPFKVEKGNYRFRILAGAFGSLPLTVNVSQQGTYKTEFTTSQSNMQGNVGSTFTFNADLKNRTAEKQLYALLTDAPLGWNVTFKAKYKSVTSVDIEANSTENITIDIKPPDNIGVGTYEIPVKASTNSTSATVSLQVAITGSYKMELTTSNGLLSSNITAGDEKQVVLLVKNTGSLDIADVEMSASTPASWDVTFEPKKISDLIAGKESNVVATIKAGKKAIPGDYMVNINAKTSSVSSQASLRIAVKTPMLWGWIGVLIIIIAAGSVYYLFRKYGRR